VTRVLQLCCDPGVVYGGTKGASVHLAELSAALAAGGAEVRVIVTAIAPGAIPPVGVTVEVLPGPARGSGVDDRLAAEPARAEWLTARLRDWRADLLYERAALHTAAGSVAAGLAGVPHVVELNAPLPVEAARYRRLDAPESADRLERTVLADADIVLAVSRPLATYARARGARRVEMCPNAVDPARFPPADAAAVPVGAVFAGSLRPWHGAGVLADAWVRLGADAPHLLVVGDGTGRDRLDAVGATVTGLVAHDDVPRLLASAQIGVAPYPSDAPCYFSPLKLFEYLAAGLAVVAADLPGVADIAGDVAVLVPPGDAAALAGAVADLVSDPARRGRLGAAGRALVRSEHTWSHRARQVLALARPGAEVAAP
jgi:glycosyltransferase involved in cell wall biosynthesis